MARSKLFLLGLLLSSTLALVNCGGGGSSPSTPPPPAAPQNQNPSAKANGPYAGTSGIEVLFDAKGSSDPDNDTLTYSWDFGDGTAVASGSSVTHAFQNTGSFNVKLTVTDGRGGAAADTATATITAFSAGAFLYLLDSKNNTLITLQVNASNGLLRQSASLPVASSGVLVASRNSRFLYLLSAPNATTVIKTFALDPDTGTPTEIPGAEASLSTAFRKVQSDPAHDRFLVGSRIPATGFTPEVDILNIIAYDPVTGVPHVQATDASDGIADFNIEPDGSFLGGIVSNFTPFICHSRFFTIDNSSGAITAGTFLLSSDPANPPCFLDAIRPGMGPLISGRAEFGFGDNLVSWGVASSRLDLTTGVVGPSHAVFITEFRSDAIAGEKVGDMVASDDGTRVFYATSDENVIFTPGVGLSMTIEPGMGTVLISSSGVPTLGSKVKFGQPGNSTLNYNTPPLLVIAQTGSGQFLYTKSANVLLASSVDQNGNLTAIGSITHPPFTFPKGDSSELLLAVQKK